MKVASVATAFPSGQSPIDVKLADVREAVALGADEIDMVIDRGAFLSGRYAKVVDEIVRVKDACGDAHLKVILETGELGTYDNVRRASLLAIAAGADFIKTSTGKVSPAATLPVTLCMLEVIRDVHDETGRVVGMKPAGGIRTAKQAIQYLCVLNETLGHGLDDARPVPLRRLVAPQRRADADPQAAHRAPTSPATTSRSTDGGTRRPRHARFRRRSSGSTHLRPRRATSSRSRSATASTSTASRLRRDRGSGFATTSPSTEEHLAEVALAGARDVDLAVQAARGAFEDGWSSLRPAERAKYLFRIARLIQERSRELAVAESLDGGKPIKESRDVDLPLAAAHFFYYAGWADKLEYAFPNRRPRPLGVAGQIIPWNFPLLMLAWKIAPALACGNTVVLKPAETTPLTALIFTDICRQAELPAGVVNIITGDGSTGAHLVKHPGLDKVAFTGSTEVGKAIQRELAGTGVKLTLELGGKAANIVFDDCALDQAVEGIVNGIYFNQGHVCCAGSRLLVQESIYEPLVAKLKRRLRTIRVGDPLDKNTDLGAINSRMQLDRIRSSSRAGTEEGAEMYQPPCRLPEKGYWFAPTVFTNVAQSSRIAQEEIFGPVLSVLTFRTPGGGRREGEQHAVRALRRACGRRRARASSGWPSACAPASSGRTRSTASTRPRRSAATRSRASDARAACTGSSRT